MTQSLAIPRVIPGDWKRLDLIINKIKFHLGSASSPTFTGVTITGLTASRIVATDANKVLVSLASPLIVTEGGTGLATLTDHGILLGSGTAAVTPLGVASNGQIPIGSAGADPVLATITGTTDHISVSNGAGSITLDLDTNTKILLGSFNGIFLEKLDFTIAEAGGTVTGSLEQDNGGDLIQKFSDGYTTLDCTPALTIDLTAYVGTNAVPKVVFVYILQSAKTVMAASNSDWPGTEHIKIARLVLKSAITTGTDGGALGNQNWNDYAFDATGEGHILDVEHRLRQEPAQYESGVALTLKNSAGAALTTGNSSTAVELVTSVGKIFQLHLHAFPALDMYSSGDDVHIANQVVDEGGAYSSTEDLVTDITRYVDGNDAGAAIGTNKYFNLIIWGVINREGEVSHLMINLPTGQYTTSGNAIADIDGTSTFDIPLAFKGTGFLVARLTFRLIAGAQWTYVAQEDLRGQTPVVSAGVGVTTTDHALLANLTAPADDHTQYLLADGTRALAGAWDMGSQALTNVNIDSGVITGITDLAIGDGGTGASSASAARTNLGLVIGTNVQAYDAGLLSLAGLTYASASFVKMTGANTFVLRTLQETLDDLEATIDHDNLLNFAANEHYLQSAIATVGTISSGTWQGTTIAINQGGTGQTTAQAAINALSAVSGATNEHVLTKDTATGNAIWKVAAGGGVSTWIALTDTDPANYTGQAGNTVVVNAGEDGLEFGVAPGGTFSSQCSVYCNTNQTINYATTTKVALDAENYDTDSEFDSTTNYRFVATSTGYYAISARVFITGLGQDKYGSLKIKINNTTFISELAFSGAVTYGGGGAFVVDAYLTATDYVEMFVYHEQGAGQALNLEGNNLKTGMTVHRFA